MVVAPKWRDVLTADEHLKMTAKISGNRYWVTVLDLFH